MMAGLDIHRRGTARRQPEVLLRGARRIGPAGHKANSTAIQPLRGHRALPGRARAPARRTRTSVKGLDLGRRDVAGGFPARQRIWPNTRRGSDTARQIGALRPARSTTPGEIS
jgi:hypothetical protein